jgi:2'-5' RNA ligase
MAGLVLPRERFRPHVTLARFQRGLRLQDIETLRRFLNTYSGFPAEPFRVAEFSLFQSRLTPDGALHDRLADYPLDPA